MSFHYILYASGCILISGISEVKGIGLGDSAPQPSAKTDTLKSNNESRISTIVIIAYVLLAIVIFLLMIFCFKKLKYYWASRELGRRVQLATNNQDSRNPPTLESFQEALPKYSATSSQLMLPASAIDALTTTPNEGEEYELKSVTVREGTYDPRSASTQTHRSPLPGHSDER
ncbi:hypothetical protein K7432_012240 [Basidiobolus ranarum]|uniref:Uncharacterized protein n=1 Tax=Basidiobolus ranarum TaxID=34480 RepID=A0ABR2WL66_9FUNG